jgi:hypothetical protein
MTNGNAKTFLAWECIARNVFARNTQTVPCKNIILMLYARTYTYYKGGLEEKTPRLTMFCCSMPTHTNNTYKKKVYKKKT